MGGSKNPGIENPRPHPGKLNLWVCLEEKNLYFKWWRSSRSNSKEP